MGSDLTVEARRIIEAVNSRDVEFLMTMLASDYVAEWPDATLDRDASIEREIVMMAGLPDTRFDIAAATLLHDGRVLLEATVVGTHTGELVSLRPIDAVQSTYGDQLGLARATHVRAALKELHRQGVIADDATGDFWTRTIRPA